MRKVVIQNRMALDMLTAAQGRTCAIIKAECCVYIPDTSVNVSAALDDMKNQVKTMSNENIIYLSELRSYLGWRVIGGKLYLSLFSSVQFSCSVMSDSLRPHESQHTRPPCLSPTPGVHSNSCPWSRWCHPAISSSVVPFSSCPQSLPASGSFPMSQLFAWGGQGIGASASASVLPMNIQDWFPLGWTAWMSLQFKGLWRIFSNTTVQKHQFFGTQLSSQSNSHIHTWPLEKP